MRISMGPVLQFSSDGDTPSKSSARTQPRLTVLPQLCQRGERSLDLRWLFLHHLPALWHAAGIFRRTRDRL